MHTQANKRWNSGTLQKTWRIGTHFYSIQRILDNFMNPRVIDMTRILLVIPLPFDVAIVYMRQQNDTAKFSANLAGKGIISVEIINR